MQYASASVEFRLLKHRYLRELRYRAGADTLTYKQLKLLTVLNGLDTDRTVLDAEISRHQRLHTRVFNEIELLTGKLSEEELVAAEKEDAKDAPVSDQDKLSYLSMLNQDNPRFGSLDEIIARIGKVQSNIAQHLERQGP